MRTSILNGLFASGGGRIWRSKRSGYGNELGGRMVISTMSKVGASAPWLMLPPGRESSGNICFNFYSLAEDREKNYCGRFPFEADKMRFVGSSHGWLALFNDRTKDLFLTNPVSGQRIDLPRTDKIVSRVVLSCSPDDKGGDECRAVMRFLSTSLPGETRAAKTLARYLPAMSLGPPESLAYCCPNNNNNAWTPINSTDRAVASYGDFLYSRKNGKGYLFCLTTNYSPLIDWYGNGNLPNLSDVEVWDLSDPDCPRIERRHSLNEMPRLVKDTSGVSERRYLVIFSDQLYLVRRHMMERVQVRGHDTGNFVKHIYYHNLRAWDNSYPYKTVRFDIHMIDDGKLLMDNKVSLDNVAIFIGINHGLVMEADQFQLNSNSIYFTDDTIHTPPDPYRDVDEEWGCWHLLVARESKWAKSSSSVCYGGHDIGIFDCNHNTLSGCYFPIDPPSLQRIDPPPLWFTPDNNISS